MEIKKFVEDFASQFEETDAAQFKPETKFRDIDEWSSLMALSIIAMVDSDYNVQIKGDDIKASQTIEDIFNIVKTKL